MVNNKSQTQRFAETEARKINNAYSLGKRIAWMRIEKKIETLFKTHKWEELYLKGGQMIRVLGLEVEGVALDSKDIPLAKGEYELADGTLMLVVGGGIIARITQPKK